MARSIHQHKSLLTPDGRLRHVPYAFRYSSANLGWSGLRVEHDTRQPGNEFLHPPLESLMLVLTGKIVPERTDHRCDDARHHGTGLPHAMNLLPPGVESQWSWRNTFDFTDSTHYQLSPALIAKVAEEAFDLDPARVQFPICYYDQSSPEVINTLSALRQELLTGGPGGRLCAESLANVLVIQLIRQISNRQNSDRDLRRASGRLGRQTLRSIEEYIHAHLHQNIALADLAKIAQLSEFHFSRLFKQATGLQPYQFVIHRRIERAKQLIIEGQLPLVQIALNVGFSDQSQLNRHFKRLVGVTPKRF